MKKTLMLVALLVALPGFAPAQKPEGDPFGRYLYPPELVMSHQEAIGLTERQRTAIQEAVVETQKKAIDTQFKLASVAEKLTRSLGGVTVEETAVLQMVDQVLAAERDVKRAQISLLVRIKNQLTADQQGMLDKFRKQG